MIKIGNLKWALTVVTNRYHPGISTLAMMDFFPQAMSTPALIMVGLIQQPSLIVSALSSMWAILYLIPTAQHTLFAYWMREA